MRIEEGFQQPPYPTEHPYTADPILPGLLKRFLPETVRNTLETDLVRLGDVLADEIRPLAPLVQPATLTQYDEFGRRVDRLHTSEGWRKIEEFTIKEGYNAVAYEREYGEHSRTFQFARTLTMTGDGHVIMCPMGMTDGATDDPSAVASFTEWAHGVIAAVPPLLKAQVWKALDTLSAAVNKLPDLFKESVVNPLLPRLVLTYFAASSCALYLLEHATWSYAAGESTVEEDVEAFRRWVLEGDLTKTEADIASVQGDPQGRAELNSKLVYGTRAPPAKL